MNPFNQTEIDRIVKELCTVLDCSFTPRFQKVETLEGKDVIEIAIRFLWKTDENNKTILPTYTLPNNVGDKVEVVNRVADLLKEVNIETDYHVLMHGRSAEIKNLCLAFVEKLPTRCINVPLFEVLHIALYMRENIVDSEDAMKSRYIRRDLTHLRSDVPERVSMHCSHCAPYPSGPRDEIINILNGPFAQSGSQLPRTWFEAIDGKDINDTRKEDRLAHEGLLQQESQEFEQEIDQVVSDLVKVGRYDPTDHTEYIQWLEAEIEEKRNVLRLAQYNRNGMFVEMESLMKYKERNDDLIETFKNSEDAERRINSIVCDFMVREIDVKKHWTETLEATLSQINNLKRRESYILKKPFLEDIARIEEQLRNMTDMANIREDALPMIKKIVREVPERCQTREDLFAQLDEVRERYGKQRDTLNKIQLDIDMTKKELAWLSESLVRSFNIIEEELFKYAESMKGEDSYRLFARVNLACVDSINFVKCNGELEKELERVKSRCIELRTGTKSKELMMDIEAIREQNSSLEDTLEKIQQEMTKKKDLKRKHIGTEQDDQLEITEKMNKEVLNDSDDNVPLADHDNQEKKDLKRKLQSEETS